MERPRPSHDSDVSSRRSILIVEDDPLTRVLLIETLESAGFEVFSAADAQQAQVQFAAKDPDGVVLDVDLGHGLTGFDLSDAFHRHDPAIAIVYLTHLPDSRFMSRDPASLPKTAAYLRKDQLSNKELLVSAIDAALRGAVTSQHRHDQDDSRRVSLLSRTQFEVMIMVSRGMTNTEIAIHRGTQPRTVQKVVNRSLEIMGIDSTLDQSERLRAIREFLRASDPTATKLQ